MLMASNEGQGHVPEHQRIDERIGGGPGPVAKWNTTKERADFICPHCWLYVGCAERGEWTPPQEVHDHLVDCEGIRPWQLGLLTRRREKAKWMARNRQSLC